MERSKPKVIIYTAGNTKSTAVVVRSLKKMDPEITKVKILPELVTAFQDDAFDLLIGMLIDEEENTFRKTMDYISGQMDATVVCVIGKHASEPHPCVDFCLPPVILEYPEILESFWEGTITISRREKNKNELSAMLTHDLRSPLQSVLGYLELLQNEIFGPMNEGQHQILSNAVSLSEVIINLLEELSQVFQYESKEFIIQKSLLTVKDFLDDVLRALWIQADKKNIKFIPQIATGLPDVNADKLGIQRVLMNLLTNAISFSPVNSVVRIEVLLIPSPSGKRMIQFKIVDSGPGIPVEYMDHVFDKYYRLKDKKPGRKKGFGLGLYVCKIIVEAHQGQIGMYNNREGGSTFYFSLPAHITEGAG